MVKRITKCLAEFDEETREFHTKAEAIDAEREYNTLEEIEELGFSGDV